MTAPKKSVFTGYQVFMMAILAIIQFSVILETNDHPLGIPCILGLKQINLSMFASKSLRLRHDSEFVAFVIFSVVHIFLQNGLRVRATSLNILCRMDWTHV